MINKSSFMEMEQQHAVSIGWDSPARYNIEQENNISLLSITSTHRFPGASGSFKRNFTGTKWFHCFSPINREQQQLKKDKKTKAVQSFCIFVVVF